MELDSIANGVSYLARRAHPPNQATVAATSRNLSANQEILRFVTSGRARPR